MFPELALVAPPVFRVRALVAPVVDKVRAAESVIEWDPKVWVEELMIAPLIVLVEVLALIVPLVSTEKLDPVRAIVPVELPKEVAPVLVVPRLRVPEPLG